MEQYIITAATTLLVTIITAISTVDMRRRKKQDAKQEARAAIREEESRLSMAMMSASIDLGLATALAVKEHKINGEMADATASAKKAQSEYRAFLARIAARQVAK